MGSFLSSLLGAEASASGESKQPEDSRVTAYHSSDKWRQDFNSSKELNKLIVVDFSAKWCGPCRFIEPVFHELSTNFTDVVFAKIDVDELSDVAREFKVEAMPTFVLLKQGKEEDRVVGANKNELEKKIQKHKETPKFAA